jgi:L-threonylcarbamoyladenylate synthase
MNSLSLEQLEHAVSALLSGRVVAAATESTFGLLADAERADAVERVFAIKGRDEGKGVALITPSLDAWRRVVTAIPPAAESLARAVWPGPLTIALDAHGGLDSRLQVQGTVGVRMPGACHAAEIARAFGRVLTATSANLAGEPPLCDSGAVQRQLSPRDAELFIVAGDAPGGAPSTVVKVDGAEWTIVRPGAVDRGAIERALDHPSKGPDRRV